METLQTVSYLFDNCHMLQDDVLSIVVTSGGMFNKNVCLFSKTNKGLKIEASHNTQHARSPIGPHPPDLLLSIYVPSTALSIFMKFFLRP